METYIWNPEDEPTEDPSQTGDAMAPSEELLLRPEEDELEITAAFLHVRVCACVRVWGWVAEEEGVLVWVFVMLWVSGLSKY